MHPRLSPRLLVRLIAVAAALALAGTSLASSFGFRDEATETSLALATAAVPLPGGGFLIADAYAHRVYKVDGSGNITPAAGTGEAGYDGDNGPAISAKIQSPIDAVPTPDGGFLIAASTLFGGSGPASIRKVSSTGTITTVAGGVASNGAVCPGATNTLGDGCPPTQAKLATPTTAVQRDNGSILIAEMGNNRVRQVSGGIITTVAGGSPVCPGATNSIGDGCPATEAVLSYPSSAIPFDIDGASVNSPGDGYLISEVLGCRVRYVTSAGVISTVAGAENQCHDNNDPPVPASGSTSELVLRFPADARPTGTAGEFLVADGYSCRVYRVNMNTDTYTTPVHLPECGGSFGLTASLPLPGGNFLIADTAAAEILHSTPTGTVTTVAGNGESGLNTEPPEISGNPAVGQTLTCSNGTWSQTPTGYERQWKRNGNPIAGATETTYVVAAADAGSALTCTVTASYPNPAGGSLKSSATSAPVQIPGGGGPGPGPGGGGGGGANISNAFTVAGTAAAAKKGNVKITLNVPGPGLVSAIATAKVQVSKKKKITVASAKATAASAGTVVLTLKPKKKAKKTLKSKGKLKASVKITYTPNGGSANSTTKSVTFKLAKKKKKKKR